MDDREVAALYVDARGPYIEMPGVDCWTIERDARRYDGPSPVVAHPPCADWSRLRAFARRDDARRSCGPRAVQQVRDFGGVLEHPAWSSLWKECGLPKPYGVGYLNRSTVDAHGGWTIGVNQCDFGHRAQKHTWLYIVGARARDVPELPPAGEATHVVSALGKTRLARATRPQLPEMSKADRHLTPQAFAEWLVSIARAVGDPC